MKKLSMLMAAVMLSASCLCFTASAENEVIIAVNAPTEVGMGAETTVSVDFSGNTGFNTLGVKLTYPEGFTYVDGSATIDQDLTDDFYLDFGGYQGETYVFYHDATARTITFVGASLYDIDTASDTLFTAKFTAPDAEATGKQFKIEKVDDVYTQDGTTVTVQTVDDSMNVVEITYKLGDANLDGSVDYLDAILVLQAYAGIANLDATQTLAANVISTDTAIDYLDAIAILQIFAGVYQG